MRVKKILFTSHFKRAMKRLSREMIDTVKVRERIFRENFFDRRLGTHKLKGKLKSFLSFSLTHSHRVLFEILEDGVVVFIDIGDHAIYQQARNGLQ